MQLQVNQVYRDISKEKLFRILALSTEKDIAIVIQINDERDLKLPIEVNYSELYEQINQGSYEIIEDPIRLLSETQLTTIQIERTDKIWRLIRGFVSDQTQCFDKKKRRQFIKEISEAEGLRPETVQSWLHRYWAGGSMKAALIPNYRAKGAPGKQRLETKERVGRKGKYQSDSQKMKVGETELEQISWVMNHYYNKNTKYGMNYCYKKLIEKYYTDQVSGMVQDPHPTFEQFKYRAYKLLNLKKRLGEKKFERDYRSKLGNSREEAYGPGDKYQIDATLADVYLVSKTDRTKCVGRPVLYFVTDVFSRMITGFYISLSGPSWMDAMMAVYYTAMDKVELCKRFEISITEEMWPCKGLPRVFLTDNGELVSKKSNALVEALGIHMENASAWRPDWKGIVEQSFHLLNENTKMILPGSIQPDFRERGGHDYRLDATLNLHEFYKVIVQYILKHNSKMLQVMPQQEEDVLSSGIPPVPLTLWNWGVKNRAGGLKMLSREEIIYGLLPGDSARVTHRGIRFKGRMYSCDTYVREQWGSKATIKGTWSIPIKYDPRFMEQIIYCREDGKYELCRLVDQIRKDWFEEDLLYQSEFEKYQQAEGREKNLQHDIDFNREIQEIIERAEQEKREQLEQDKIVELVPKGTQIRKNRKEESQAQKEEERFLGRDKERVRKKQTEASEEKKPQSLDTKNILEYMKKEEWDE